MPGLLEIGPVVLKKKIFELFSYHLPFEKGVTLFCKTMNLLNPRMTSAYSWLDWTYGYREEDFKIFSDILLFRYYMYLSLTQVVI